MYRILWAWTIALVLLAFPSRNALADYSANHTSTVKWVKIYNTDVIYFQLNIQPTTACAQPYFMLSTTLTSEQRNRYYAMLLAANATGDVVRVGYGTEPGDCHNDRAIVYALQAE